MALLKLNFYSHKLGMATNVNVLFPEQATDDDLQLVYLLHGLSDDSNAWLNNSSVARYIMGKPIVVVMPEVGRSFYHDIGEGANYYSYLSEELPAQVAYFLNRTIPAERTHVMGLSMGGFGALKWGLNQAEKFATVVSFSGAMYLDELWKNDSGRNTEFTRLFGKSENIPLSINDLEHTYCHAEKVNPQLVVRQYCGDLDFLYAYNRKLEAFAQSRSLDYRFSLGIGENHTWSYWDKSLEKTLGELFNK
ncbi:alpha/beta hydrolase [Brochothrix thermosphacta]|uniref:alpha/beta hydrolase n=1 Tax=Brochothrix thermosphacta TaxID=2756 RepID=UPI00083F667E|nr:alpha/beta hydrolase-fold protein [Brochothrix thermosphacta]ODJ63830.1 hypothetical protein BFR35_07890 [Brochothrix thermosphacta]